MAKGNMLLGHARGKVGDLVFARQNGQQTVRSRAAVVKNPQTKAQMIQRIFLNTVSQAYSKMSPIVNHSFEGIPEGQKSMSYFMKRNLAILRSRVSSELADDWDYSVIYAFTRLGANYFAPNEYEISKGQLPAISVDTFAGSYAETSVAATDGVTYQDIIDSVGLQRGDQLTFIGIHGTDVRADFLYARVILDPRNADGTAAGLDTPFIADGVVNLPSSRNEGSVLLKVEDNQLAFSFADGVTMMCAAVIVSRKGTDGLWKRSNASLAVSDSFVMLSGTSLQDCLDALKSGGLETENPLYLNNAGTTSGGSGSSPTPTPTTDREVLTATKGGVTMTAGENGSAPSAMMSGNAISGTLSGNNTAQKVYAINGASAKPVVGGTLPSEKTEMTVSGGSFSGNADWNGTLPGDTYYFGVVVAEGTTIKQVFCTYTS